MPQHRLVAPFACIAVLVAHATAADPPVAKKPAYTRSTTMEEFAALAKDGPKPPWLPFLGVHRVEDDRVEGTVIDVSAGSIEIRPQGKKEAVKYPAYTLLETGAVCHWLNDSECYLLDDVKKGDVVLLGVGVPEKGAEVHCFYLSIRERPGGVIPASRKPSEYTVPYHEDRQRTLDYKKRGERTPEEVQRELEKKQFMTERGLTVPPSKTTGGDPPTTEPKKDDPTKEEKKRPTTREEFAALAKAGPRPPWLPFGPGHNMVRDERINGTVVAVSREAIEIRPWGKKETVKYPPHTLLDTGAVCHWETDSKCYLLDDVQKGDEVLLGVGTVDKEKGEECFYVRIRKRPGGVIPPSRKPSELLPYHRDTQAEIDHFEKGTPLPEHLQPKTTPTGRPLPPSRPPLTAPKEDPVAPPPASDPPKKDEKK